MNWLIRQLTGAPDSVRIEAYVARGRGSSAAELLGAVREPDAQEVAVEQAAPASLVSTGFSSQDESQYIDTAVPTPLLDVEHGTDGGAVPSTD